MLDIVASAPWYKLIGMKPKLEGDTVVVELEVKKDKHYQALGTAHGGVIASVLDSAIGLNLNRKLFNEGKVAVTAQLNVHYLKPVTEGKIIGKGKIIHIGSRIAVGYGEVFNERGEKLAAATATFYIVER